MDAGTKPTHILGLILLGMALLNAKEAYLSAHALREPAWSAVSTALVVSVLIFWWYWTDSTLRSYRRSPLLNVAVVSLAFLAIPYYLVRSRPRGERLKAILRLLGFSALVVLAMLAGAVPVLLTT